MKNLFKTILLIVLAFTSANAQIKKINRSKINKTVNIKQNKINYNFKNQYLDLETIKSNIKSGKKCYALNVSSTAIVPPKYPKSVKAIDAYYSASQYIRVERDYLRSNGLLLRSDAGFAKYRGNNYEVIIYPLSRNKKEIDQRRVKITWNIPGSGVQTFTLRHVSIQYKTYGILIIGDYNVNGIIFGVSISLTPTGCLI